jgi:integrase
MCKTRQQLQQKSLWSTTLIFSNSTPSIYDPDLINCIRLDQWKEVGHERINNMDNSITARIIEYPKLEKLKQKHRKSGLNNNKEGSIRKINGNVYVDFIYLDERVRENSGFLWNDKNAKHVRERLDKIMIAIKDRTFRFAQVFPRSKKADYFAAKEIEAYKLSKTSDQLLFKDYVWLWYDIFKGTGRVKGRTLWGYKSYINCYLVPFFGELSFAEFNTDTFDQFVVWAKKQKYRGRPIENPSINKIFTLLKMIVKKASSKYGWGSIYNPFFDFKKLPTDDHDPYEKIFPFSLREQAKIINNLPDHWKPYFDVALKIGLSPGEQIALKPNDIDWGKGLLHIKNAITTDDNGKTIEGPTKNKYRRRTIKLTPGMLTALKNQKRIYDQYQCKYFFCTTTGERIDLSNLRDRIWNPFLLKANVEKREMKQTRHSFATNALSCMENPLWIAKVMGHRDTNMIIKVYSKYIMDATGSSDGSKFDNLYTYYNGKEE